MKQLDHYQIKHFVLICPHVQDSAFIDNSIKSLDYPLKFTQDNSENILLSLPRNTINASLNHFKPMVCGDDQDLDPAQSMFLGNGIYIKKEPDGNFVIASSLTGLPPLYMYSDSRCTVISDSIDTITKIPDCSLHYDTQAVLELAKIGFPIKHRTLFKEIKIIPAGSMVTVSDKNIDVIENAWQPSYSEQFNSLEDYVDKMSQLMQLAISRMNLKGSFLSLTAGLDTRAILAALIIENKLIPAFTISGTKLTLDAMRGRQLCSAYDIPHSIIAIDNASSEKLPEYTLLASRYSGGISSIEQATEIYFNQMVESTFTGRLSGNLGNQIGRSGSEGTGTRNAPTTSLNTEINSHLSNLDSQHWFFQVNSDKDLLAPEFLIQKENLFAQISNYSIGHETLIQHTPYADRSLINAKYSELLTTRDNPKTISEIKMRDLKHRIIGQSPDRSFQCRVTQIAGGKVASCPINWGWTTDGGFSVGGLYYGAKAFADILIGNKLNNFPRGKKLMEKAGIKGFSSFHTQHILYSKDMQSYIKDILLKQKIRESGLFNKNRLDYLIDKGFDEQSNYSEIVLTLDLALACENFNATV